MQAHPEPATPAPPYNSHEFDVRTGVCSTVLRQYVDVNLGPNSLPRRRKPQLQLAVDPAVGGTVTGQARWQVLLPFLRDLTNAGNATGPAVSFRMRQDGQILWFETFAPRDLTGTVKLSTDLGTMASYGYKTGRPKATYWYAGGSGEGTARLIREGQDGGAISAGYGLIEAFIEQSDAGTNTLLDQAIGTAKQQAGAESTLTLVPADIESMSFFDDYYVGDKVTAAVHGVLLTQSITEAKITFGANGVSVEPTVGTASSNMILQVFRRLLSLERTVERLKRR